MTTLKEMHCNLCGNVFVATEDDEYTCEHPAGNFNVHICKRCIENECVEGGKIVKLSDFKRGQ